MKYNKLLGILSALGEQAKRKSVNALMPLLFILLITGCSTTTTEDIKQVKEVAQEVEVAKTDNETVAEEQKESITEKQESNENSNTREYNGTTYTIIEVDGADLSGDRQANVAVNIGFGDREYWAYTNEYGQLIYVTADNIVLQDDSTEPVNLQGRYYSKQANVLGIEKDKYDRGHIIADSLGGVSNAYNITPQDSTLNRHGDQAYMEKVIRDANGCENFVATITYPDTTTQTPSHYHYEYTLKGENIVDDFDNVNPDEVNAKAESKSNKNNSSSDSNSVAERTTTSQDTTVKKQTEELADNTDQTGIEVHITKSGKKYHSAGCQYLSKSDIITTLDKAKAKGLEPCSKCSPPQ